MCVCGQGAVRGPSCVFCVCVWSGSRVGASCVFCVCMWSGSRVGASCVFRVCMCVQEAIMFIPCVYVCSGSRAGAIIAACWATMMFIGEEGYIQSTTKIITTTQHITDK